MSKKYRVWVTVEQETGEGESYDNLVEDLRGTFDHKTKATNYATALAEPELLKEAKRRADRLEKALTAVRDILASRVEDIERDLDGWRLKENEDYAIMNEALIRANRSLGKGAV